MVARYLRYFLAVADEEHLNRAAQKLNITPSALSRRIKDLESRLEVPLFERVSRSVRLTEAGRFFHEQTRLITAQLERAVDDTRGIQRGTVGTIRLGINETSPRHSLVPRIINKFQEQNPRVKMVLTPVTSSGLVQRICNREMDVAFILSNNQKKEDLQRVKLSEERLMLAIPRHHPLAGNEKIKLSDLSSESFVWTSGGLQAPISNETMRMCNQAGLFPNIVFEAPTELLRMGMVSLGVAIGFSLRSESPYPETVVFKEIDDLQLTWDFELIWRTGPVDIKVNKFVELAREHTFS